MRKKNVQNRSTTTKFKWKLITFPKLTDSSYFNEVKCLEELSFWIPAFLNRCLHWTVECVNANRAILEPAFSCEWVCPALKCCLRPGSVLLIPFLRSLPGKKFVNSDKISFSSVSSKHYYWFHTEQTLVVQHFELFVCRSYRCVVFIDSFFLASLAVCTWIEEHFFVFSKTKSLIMPTEEPSLVRT